ncbi:MAG TPA: amino acid adenylation domain-containing protein, partial [Thermoanaerobaculia bacterium]
YLARALSEQRITQVIFVPSMLEQILAAGGLEDRAALRFVGCGAEALPAGLVELFYSRVKEAPAVLQNLYGPTEASIVAAAWTYQPEHAERNPLPIGRAYDNTTTFVLDDRLQPMPIGAPGELCVGGVGVTRGYLARPGLTASAFVPDPFSSLPGARLYRTGDLARLLPDGNLLFLGRRDQQVKLRGIRIEPGEVESALADHPAVRTAVVVARETLPGSTRLVAYIVLEEEAANPVGGLAGFLRDRLPEALIPSLFIVLPALPLTASGKLDRQALPGPDLATAGALVAPRTSAEEKLAAIWIDLLKVERVGVTDSFFELGGHSLLATQVISRTRSAFRVDVPLRRLFETPTIEGLAAAVARARAERGDGAGFADALPPVVPNPADRHEPFPLTAIQQAYLVGRSGAFDLGNVASHSYVEFESVGLDVERLSRALDRLIARHDMLRAVFLPDGRQCVLPTVPPYLIAIDDLRGLPAERVEASLAAVRAELSHHMLPVDCWPLFEIRASQLDGGKVRLHMSRDALVTDAWSEQVLNRELILLYEDPEAVLPGLDLSFRDYVLAEAALRGTELDLRSRQYWQNRLASLPPAPQLPLIQNPAAYTRPHFGRRSGSLEASAWQRLKSRGASGSLTPSALVLAAFAEILAAWSENPRFTVNLTLFNRLPLHRQVDEIVGDFTSLTLLAVDSSIPGTFAVRARRLQEQLWDDLEHRYVSGVEILRQLARREGRAPGPLMPVVFTSTLTLPATKPPRADSPLSGTFIYSITQTPQVWLDHQVSESNGGLDFNWDTVDDLFPAGLLDAMFAEYCGLLARLAADEDTWHEPWRPWLSEIDGTLREATNRTMAPVNEHRLEALFRSQAEAAPERVAVLAPERILSYGELSRRADWVTACLQHHGAGRHQLVAVVMEKGWEQVVAVLGILGCGAAYLPIDAGLPRERVWQLLDLGGVELVVTQPWLAESLTWPAEVRRLVVVERDEQGGDERLGGSAGEATDLAYVIFTSGSTGVPKGVMIDHRGAVNSLLDINRRFAVGPHDRLLALSSLSFDLSVFDVFGLLAAGGAIVLPETAVGRDPARWVELIAAHRVTIWNSVPALMEMLVEHEAGRFGTELGSLRLALLSGDWIPLGLPERIRRLSQGVSVVSLGGATEASIWSILHLVEQVDPAWASIPYGQPLANQSFYVLDELLEPRPVWVPGSLYIGGLGLALGYWGDAVKTAASFVPAPQGERLYRTGDLGRYLQDGSIELLGREDLQVKVQGHRIELGEIEAVLLRHPGVRATVVNAVGRERTRRRLVAYVVPAR